MLSEVQLPPCLADRDVHWLESFSLAARDFDVNRINCGPGKMVRKEDCIHFEFGDSGKDESISQQVRVNVNITKPANGMGMRVRLQGWKSISYIAIGHTEENKYQHVKAHNPRQQHWFDFCIGFNDLAWGWCNSWETPSNKKLDDVRLYIRGIPGAQASCDVSEVFLWLENEDPESVFGIEESTIPPGVFENLLAYQRQYTPNFISLASSYMTEGRCPLDGNVLLDWPANAERPPLLGGKWYLAIFVALPTLKYDSSAIS